MQDTVTVSRELLRQIVDALRQCEFTTPPAQRKIVTDAKDALRAALEQPAPVQEPRCNPHPKAPHGFDRNASHSAHRYVCECESWEPYDAGYNEGFHAGLKAEQALCELSDQTQEMEAQPRKAVNLTGEEVGMLTVFDGLHHVETPLLAEFIRAIEQAVLKANGVEQ